MILQWNADHIFDQDPPVSQEDFPGGSDGKAPVYNVGDLGSIPVLGRSPGGGHGNPFLPGESPWTEEPSRL